MQLEIKRNNVIIASPEIDDSTIFTQKLMGEHKIVSDFITSAPLPAQLGDYIEHGLERFYINTPPDVEKINNFTYRYLVTFEGEIYRLYAKIFMHLGQADFSYHGTPETFLLLLLENINSVDPGWNIEKVEDATAQTLSFKDASCRSALTMIAEAFNLEFRLVGKSIYLERSVGADTILEFQYGKGLGLYNLQRNKIEDKNVVTRVYGFGARKNLNYDYRDGSNRLVFEERKLEKNIDLYGIREGSVTFDEIYPERTGSVTAIEEDIFVIKDAELPFNLTMHLLEGVTAKIVFKTGALSGYEFEIQSYRHSDRRIKFGQFVEENGYTLPNALNFAEPGDEYTLVDIRMPQIYIDEAEARLKERTLEYLEENSVPRAAYSLSIDEKYVRERGIELKVANLVRVVDTGLGINNKIRVAEVSYPVINPEQVTAVIADSIPYTIQERIISETVDNNTQIENVDRRNIELARRAALRFRELQKLIFDPDGYFDPQIKPGSIETLMLSVGARSQDFALIGVTIEANAGGNVNTLKISGGQLVHYQIEIEGLGYIWEMDPEIFSNLIPEKHYYVYARCSATSLTGTWGISETPKAVDSEAGHYIFNLGILYAVKEGRRDFDLTKGMTYINGSTITTGTIKSLDGLNYFNLSEGKFKIGNEESSLDYNVTKEGQLTLKGVLLTSFIIAENAAIENLTVRSLRTNDSEGRRLEIQEVTNNMVLYNSDGEAVVTVDDGVDGRSSSRAGAGIVARDPERETVATLSTNGIFSNNSNMRREVPTPPGSRSLVWSSISGVLSKINSGISAAISGINPFTDEDTFGGYFFGGVKIEGGGSGLMLKSALHVNCRRITDQNSSLNDTDYLISWYSTRHGNLNLPANPKEGRVIIIRRMTDSYVRVHGNGKKIAQNDLEDSLIVGGGRGDAGMFQFDGDYWLYNVIRR